MMFKDKIVKFRKEKGLTQTQLGDCCDVTKECISLIERGIRKPYLETAVKIARALNVSLDLLVE